MLTHTESIINPLICNNYNLFNKQSQLCQSAISTASNVNGIGIVTAAATNDIVNCPETNSIYFNDNSDHVATPGMVGMKSLSSSEMLANQLKKINQSIRFPAKQTSFPSNNDHNQSEELQYYRSIQYLNSCLLKSIQSNYTCNIMQGVDVNYSSERKKESSSDYKTKNLSHTPEIMRNEILTGKLPISTTIPANISPSSSSPSSLSVSLSSPCTSSSSVCSESKVIQCPMKDLFTCKQGREETCCKKHEIGESINECHYSPTEDPSLISNFPDSNSDGNQSSNHSLITSNNITIHNEEIKSNLNYTIDRILLSEQESSIKYSPDSNSMLKASNHPMNTVTNTKGFSNSTQLNLDDLNGRNQSFVSNGWLTSINNSPVNFTLPSTLCFPSTLPAVSSASSFSYPQPGFQFWFGIFYQLWLDQLNQTQSKPIDFSQPVSSRNSKVADELQPRPFSHSSNVNTHGNDGNETRNDPFPLSALVKPSVNTTNDCGRLESFAENLLVLPSHLKENSYYTADSLSLNTNSTLSPQSCCTVNDVNNNKSHYGNNVNSVSECIQSPLYKLYENYTNYNTVLFNDYEKNTQSIPPPPATLTNDGANLNGYDYLQTSLLTFQMNKTSTCSNTPLITTPTHPGTKLGDQHDYNYSISTTIQSTPRQSTTENSKYLLAMHINHRFCLIIDYIRITQGYAVNH
ncbi:unnamed protein product [Heterobilharzia americana]|nr:unnamed protein product [Heterobilharzia americana]